MKKALVLVVLLASAGRLMAQNDLKPKLASPFPLLQITVDTTLLSPTLKQLTKIPDANYLKKLGTLGNFNQTPQAENKLIGHMDGYTMPVVVLAGKSTMPVKKIGGFYKMPVVGDDFNKKSTVTLIHP
jgi:hypothetical protein